MNWDSTLMLLVSATIAGVIIGSVVAWHEWRAMVREQRAARIHGESA